MSLPVDQAVMRLLKEGADRVSNKIFGGLKVHVSVSAQSLGEFSGDPKLGFLRTMTLYKDIKIPWGVSQTHPSGSRDERDSGRYLCLSLPRRDGVTPYLSPPAYGVSELHTAPWQLLALQCVA